MPSRIATKKGRAFKGIYFTEGFSRLFSNSAVLFFSLGPKCNIPLLGRLNVENEVNNYAEIGLILYIHNH